ncbi:hypothetical protein SEA_JONJAMES_152 [Gordonia Phage JonJames]|nr:hypothetical protein SEA_JONJAMES_152 [Gordonia Phage JonJames]
MKVEVTEEDIQNGYQEVRAKRKFRAECCAVSQAVLRTVDGVYSVQTSAQYAHLWYGDGRVETYRMPREGQVFINQFDDWSRGGSGWDNKPSPTSFELTRTEPRI